jgi:hypothetical protein
MFCEDQVLWECNQLQASEDNQIHKDKTGGRNPNLSHWIEAVERFMKCDITDENDVLPAMAGIARRTAEVTGFSYCAGVWLERLPESLLWSSSGAKKVRRETYVGPTFSWAASKGPVSYTSLSFLGVSGSYEFCEYVNCIQDRPEGSDDPYGAVKRVGIRLRGPALKATSLIALEAHQYLIIRLQNGESHAAEVDFDHEDNGNDIERVFVLPIFGGMWSIHALVLLRATEDLAATWKELPGICYQRIGFCYWQLSGLKVEGQERLTKTDFLPETTLNEAFISNIQEQRDTITLI